jgi:hypothetical protein
LSIYARPPSRAPRSPLGICNSEPQEPEPGKLPDP